jgi:ATP-binding cassette subfamily B protein
VRARVAVIFQDFVRYAFPAKENVAVSDIGTAVDENRVRQAAADAGADEFLAALPEGYDTMLSRMFRGGRDLSGGQWQRVAIARAFYRDSPLVILDEPTAALDPRAEHDLYTSLRRVLDDRSAVFISHRFSSVRSADRIYVLDDGEVVEHGTHDQLMAAGGLYAELFTLQADAYLASVRTDRA